MHAKSKPYRDTWAAPGSQLHEALESGDTARAERIYQECEKDAKDLLTRYPPRKPWHIGFPVLKRAGHATVLYFGI